MNWQYINRSSNVSPWISIDQFHKRVDPLFWINCRFLTIILAYFSYMKRIFYIVYNYITLYNYSIDTFSGYHYIPNPTHIKKRCHDVALWFSEKLFLLAVGLQSLHNGLEARFPWAKELLVALRLQLPEHGTVSLDFEALAGVDLYL